MRDGDDTSKIADEVSSAAVLISEVLYAKGNPSAPIKVSTIRQIDAATDLTSDRNGDGKEDAHYTLWFDRSDSSVRAIDADLNGDGKKDWRIEFDYLGGMVPIRMRIDTNLDSKDDVVLPIQTSIYGSFSCIDLDDCKKSFGISGKLSVGQSPYGSLTYFDLDFKTPKRKWQKVEIQQNLSARVANFVYKP